MEQRYMEILFEEMRGKFDLVLEGHAALHAKIDALDRKVDEKFDLLAFKIDVLKERVDTVEQTLGARIDALATDLTAHRTDTERHSGYRVGE